jgi:hypothetical protein
MNIGTIIDHRRLMTAVVGGGLYTPGEAMKKPSGVLVVKPDARRELQQENITA